MVAYEAFLVVLRESLEAFLILGVLTGIVVKLGHGEARRWVYGGAAAGLALSVLLGVIIHASATGLFERYEEAFEGVASLVAVAILTYMVVWMYRHTLTLLATLRDKARSALSAGRPVLLFGLAFVAVLREGIETVLFLGATSASASAVDVVTASVLGIGVSALVALLLFAGVIRLSLQGFFAATGVLLILFGGGLLAYGVHELAEAGWIAETPQVWDTSGWLDDSSTVGGLLKAAFGYRDSPLLLELLAYVLYVGGLGAWYLRGVRLALRKQRPSPQQA